MSKQLLIYGRTAPITVTSHKDCSVQTNKGFAFAAGLNSAPLVAVEFAAAALDMTIVFSGTQDSVFPSLLLGIRDGQNLFVGPDGAWTGSYIPAFLRRYPFVFSDADQNDAYTLCIDEESEALNREGRGERLFDSQGLRSQYLISMLDFVTSYQGHYERTKLFCQRLVALKLLDGMQAQFTAPDGRTSAVSGFLTINRDRMKAVSESDLRTMFGNDELELCYLHLQSLQNIDKLSLRSVGVTPGVFP